MERSQFTFYESFSNAATKYITDPVERCLFYDIIIDYALGGKVPDLDALPNIVALAFELIKPTLDASRRKAETGKRGGESKQSASGEKANPKQSESKPQAKQKQTASKKENKKENKNKKENECYNPLTPLQEEKFSPSLLEAVNEWLRYKHERKEDYKPTGLEAMTSEIRNKAAEHGDDAVIACIRHCMAQNWKGIIWDKLAEKPMKVGKGLPVSHPVVTADELADGYQRNLRYLEDLRRQ